MTRLHRSSLFIPLCAVLLSHSALADSKAPLPQTEFNPAFGRYFAEVASDELQGRAPATVGEERTVSYIEQQFQRLGLTPFSKTATARRCLWYKSTRWRCRR